MNIKRLIIFTGLLLLFSICAFSQTERHIRIPKGIGTVNYKGSVEKLRKTYILALRSGQKVALSVTSNTGKVVFEAFYYPPNEEHGTPLTTETKSWKGKLPKAAKFTVDVYTPDGSRANYRFTIQAK